MNQDLRFPIPNPVNTKSSSLFSNCANCCRDCSSPSSQDVLYSTFTWTDNEDKYNDEEFVVGLVAETETHHEEELNLKQGFSTVFEHGIRLNKTKSSRILTTDNNEEEKKGKIFGMCLKCKSILAELYKYYVQFMKLTQATSVVASVLEESLLWTTTTHPENSPQESVLIKVPPPDDNEYDFQNVQEQIIKNKTSIKQEQILPFDTVNNDYNRDDLPDDDNSGNYDQEIVSSINESKFPIVLIKKLKIQQIDPETKARFSRSKKKSKLVSSHKRTQGTKGVKGRTNNNTQCITHSCKTCSKSFPSSLQLKYHTSSVHNKQALIIKMSSAKKKSKTKATTTRTSNMSKNVNTTIHRTPDGKKIYTCRHCHQPFPTRYKARHHRYDSHPSTVSRSYPCPALGCSNIFFNESKLSWHLVVVHNIGPRLPDRTCPVCAKYFSVPSEMKSHYQVQHLNRGKFPCSVPGCKMSTFSALRLKYHMIEVHTGQEGHMCEVCGKTYKREYRLKLHVKRFHEERTPQRFTCSVCSKSLATPEGLREHMKKLHDASNTRNVQCDQCPKAFYTNWELNKHVLKLHSGLGERPWPCTVCDATFVHKESVKIHYMAKHDTAHGPYPCTLCGKEFKAKDYLRQHMNSKSHGGKGKNHRRQSSS